MARIQINYLQSGQTRCISFDTAAPTADVLEDIGQVMATGSLYIVNDNDGKIFAIAGRFIVTVEVD